MDFQNVNPLNVRLNIISGNLLPMTSDDSSSFHTAWKIYGIVTWLIELIQIGTTICGFVLMENRESLREAGILGILVSVQTFILLMRMYAYRDLASQLIQKLNSILRSNDESIKSVVRSTLKPLEIPLEFYCIVGTASVILWCSIPLVLIFKKKYFLYDDFGMTAAFSKQPFSIEIFVLGNLFETFASACTFLKKVAMDVYMINFLLLLTAQYRYVTMKLVTILRNDTSNTSENKDYKIQKGYSINLLAEKNMKALCQHHRTIILYVIERLLTLTLLTFLNHYNSQFIA